MSYDQFRLDGKNIVITGASSGIGRQCAVECSRRGANVILIARNEKRLNETLKNMQTGKHSVLVVDITDYEQLKQQLNTELSAISTVDGFIHSAGIQMTVPFNLMSPEKYHQIFDINVCTALEIAKMITHKKHLPPSGSSIVLISAVYAIRGGNAVSGYAASKGALISVMKSMAVELARKKVRVNCISPGLIMTELVKDLYEQLSDEQIAAREQAYPFGLGDVKDIANASVFLLSDASRWITGINLVADGGYVVKSRTT